MNPAIEWLLGIDRLADADAGLDVAFAHPIAPTLVALLVVGAAALAWWSYARLDIPKWSRPLLAALRTGTLLVLLVILAGPRVVEREEIVEPDWIVVLADRSASLTIADAPPTAESNDTPTARIARERQLRLSLDQAADTFASLGADRRLLWIGFADGARPLQLSPPTRDPSAQDTDPSPAPTTSWLDALGEPDGRRTSFAAALDEAAARTAANPVAAVVVLSDGRWTDGPSRDALRTLRADAVPAFVVPLGSPEPVGDIALRRVDAPRLAFVDDPTPVTVDLERRGGEGPARAVVRLVDADSGETLDERTVDFADPTLETDANRTSDVERVVLRAAADRATDRRWRVVVEPLQDDLVADNDAADFALAFVDRPLRLLFIDGYPRWEQRYLRNLFIRERSITASTLVLAPDRRYLQEGDVEIDAVPASAEQWRDYDIVVLGDVRPEVFTSAQLAGLREHVADTGAALVWSAGPAAVPARWYQTPLADLLPFAPQAADGAAFAPAAVAAPTPAAQRIGVLRLADPASDDPDGWPDVLSSPDAGWTILRYVQRIQQPLIKPTALTLAVARAADSEPTDSPDAPLVLLMRYGAGSVLYVATDETWRWRYGRGETLFERFWLGLIRAVARERLARTGRPAVLQAAPDRALVEQPVLLTLELVDQRLIDAAPASVEIELRRTDDRAGPAAVSALTPDTVRVTLRPEAPTTSDAADSTASTAGLSYRATWLPPTPGRWTATPDAASLPEIADLAESIDVVWPLDELRRPETDHQALAAFARDTGGAVVQPDRLDRLDELIPNRERRRIIERSEPIWDSPLALVLLLTFLTLEWVLRRLVRLI